VQIYFTLPKKENKVYLHIHRKSDQAKKRALESASASESERQGVVGRRDLARSIACAFASLSLARSLVLFQSPHTGGLAPFVTLAPVIACAFASLSLGRSLVLFQFPSHWLSLARFLSLFFSLSLFLLLLISLSISFALYLSLCRSVSLSLSLCRCVAFALSVSRTRALTTTLVLS